MRETFIGKLMPSSCSLASGSMIVISECPHYKKSLIGVWSPTSGELGNRVDETDFAKELSV